MRKFSRKELAEYNGEDKPAYIAYGGRVYDVSGSFLWKKGKRQVVHYAGRDLTSELNEAPHSEELLGKFPIIGLLDEKMQE